MYWRGKPGESECVPDFPGFDEPAAMRAVVISNGECESWLPSQPATVQCLSAQLRFSAAELLKPLNLPASGFPAVRLSHRQEFCVLLFPARSEEHTSELQS